MLILRRNRNPFHRTLNRTPQNRTPQNRTEPNPPNPAEPEPCRTLPNPAEPRRALLRLPPWKPCVLLLLFPDTRRRHADLEEQAVIVDALPDLVEVLRREFAR